MICGIGPEPSLKTLNELRLSPKILLRLPSNHAEEIKRRFAALKTSDPIANKMRFKR